MNRIPRPFIACAVLAFMALLLIAANPAFQDFNANQFGTTGNKVSIKSGVTLSNANFWQSFNFNGAMGSTATGAVLILSGTQVETVTPGAAGNFLESDGADFLPTNAAFGPFYSLSPTTNGPAGNEFVTGRWVRGLLNNGIYDYASTNIITGTNADTAGQPLYGFQDSLVTNSFARSYVNPGAGTYIGAVGTTNSFTSIQGPVAVNAYIGMVSGSATIHPEIYVSYDRTNWFGDFSSSAQALVNNATNLYQWVISMPQITATNAGGLYLERRFKVNTIASSPTIYFLVGTNVVSGTNDASHIAFSSSTSSGGGAFILRAGDTVPGIIQLTNEANLFSGTYFQGTNAALTTTMTAGLSYTTNMAGPVVWASFAAVPDNKVWSIYIFATNTSGSDQAMTFPAGCSGMAGLSLATPPVYYVTNQKYAIFQVHGWGHAVSNVSWEPHQ